MKTFFTILIASVIFNSCYWKNKELLVPNVYVNMDKENFTTHNGMTWHDQTPFSGWQYSLYENADTASLIPFIDGKEYGIAKQWYANKQLKEIRLFENGKRTSEHKGWWENGQLKFIHHYTNDLFEGNQQEWYADGTKYKEMNYAEGHEKGLQKIWRPDGRLHANYEVRNGRNYGLTGNMHCKNIWKDGM
jgi:antitoxin component YwqK of YwqJK toxin-antitoxin module